MNGEADADGAPVGPELGNPADAPAPLSDTESEAFV